MLLICILASTPICPFLKERFLSWVEGRPAISICEEGVANPKCVATGSLCEIVAHPSSPARKRALSIACILYDAVLLLLLFACCASVVSGSFSPFIYFQF